nr:hypothetical protein [Tanacetum cinerariifolium]
MGQERHMQMVRGNGGNQFRQYARQDARNQNGYNVVQNVKNQVIQDAIQNTRVHNVGNQNGLIVVPGIANQNSNGNGNVVVARAEGNATGHNGIQLQDEEFDLMATVADLDEIKEVNANCILMANLQQASTSGTQTEKDPVYDSDRSAEVHNCDNCYDNEIFNMFTQEEQYTGLLEPISKLQQVPQNDNNVIYEVSSVEQSGGIVEQHPANVEETRVLYGSLYNNLATEVVNFNTVNRKLGETNAELNTELARYKNQEKCFEISQEKYNKLERCYQKDTSTCSRESSKMKQLNKEIKPANYTKINNLSRVFVSQMAKSCEELYFSNTSNTANVSKPILIPNEEFSDDTTPSVARKFLNEVESTIVSLQRVVKQRMTLDTHNWSSSTHQELHKIVKDEIFPIVNQVDARVQNFEIQFLKEAAKFVRDFKSLAKEADESFAKHKALELFIERLLRAIYDKAYNDMQQKIERLQAQLGDLKGESKDTSCVSDTLNPLSQKLENENVELEFHVLNYAKENAHLKTTYKNLFDSISVTRTQTKTIIDSLKNKLHDTIYENAKLRARLFNKVSEQKDTTRGTRANTKFAKQSILGNHLLLLELNCMM